VPSLRPLSRCRQGFQYKEKPQFLHLVVGVVVAILSYSVLLHSFQLFLLDATTGMLSLERIFVEKPLGLEAPSLVLRLPDGSDLSLTFTLMRSGFLSIIVFGLLFVFMAFPLAGPLWLKIACLEFGTFVGLAWSFIRFSTAVLIAYHFGAGALALSEFVTSSVVDFLWVIPVWSLGLSAVLSVRRKKTTRKEREF